MVTFRIHPWCYVSSVLNHKLDWKAEMRGRKQTVENEEQCAHVSSGAPLKSSVIWPAPEARNGNDNLDRTDRNALKFQTLTETQGTSKPAQLELHHQEVASRVSVLLGFTQALLLVRDDYWSFKNNPMCLSVMVVKMYSEHLNLAVTSCSKFILYRTHSKNPKKEAFLRRESHWYK